MAKTDIAVAELIWNLIAGKTGNVSRTDFFPQKPAFDDSVPVQEAKEGQAYRELSLPRAVPERQGISSVYLTHFLKELAGKKNTDIHQVLIVRNGHVICECGFLSNPEEEQRLTDTEYHKKLAASIVTGYLRYESGG